MKGPPATQDKELYEYTLGLKSPWTVSEVELNMKDEEIQVRVEHPVGAKFCCPDHGVKTVTLPWALPHSRFTIMFERLSIEVLQMTQTVKGAITILRRVTKKRLYSFYLSYA